MGKYKITGIPQYTKKGKIRKRPSRMELLELAPPVWQTSTLGMPQENVVINQPGDDVWNLSDPDPNYIPRDQRTYEQLKETLPNVYPWGVGADNLTGKIGPLLGGTYDITNKRHVYTNEYLPYNLEGERFKCPEGQMAYMGQCWPKEYVERLEQEKIQPLLDEEQRIIEEQRLAREEQIRKDQEAFAQSYEDYITKAVKKGNKHKKGVLDPFMSFPKDYWEKNKMQEQLDNPATGLKDTYYTEKEDLGDGNYKINLYPKLAIHGMIHEWGMRPYEFEAYHGLDSKKIKKEFKNEIGYADYVYQEQGTDMLDDCIKQGYSAEECEQRLVDKNYATAKGVKQKFDETAKAFDIKYNADKYFIDDGGVMYKEDKDGNVYMYANNNQAYTYTNNGWQLNDNYSIFGSGTADKDASPFAEVNDLNFNAAYGGFGWQAVDKKKVQRDTDGNLIVNNKPTGFYDYSFEGRNKGDETENCVIEEYKNTVNKVFADEEKSTAINNQQYAYTSLNQQMYDFVYGNPTSNTMDKTYDALYGSIPFEYQDEYNKAVDKINNLASISDPEVRRQKRAAVVEGFINKASNFSGKVYDNDGKAFDTEVFPGRLGFGSLAFKDERDPAAYKNKDTYNKTRDFIKNEEAQSWLYQAYMNNILPTEGNVTDWTYRGEGKPDEGTTLQDQYGSFSDFLNSDEARWFLKDYNEQPSYAQELVTNLLELKSKNLAWDQRIEAEKRMKEARSIPTGMKWENAGMTDPIKALTFGAFEGDWLLDAAAYTAAGFDQLGSLLNSPGYTLGEWFSGNLADPLVGWAPDAPTEKELSRLDQLYGPGASDVFLNKASQANKSLFNQASKLFSPTHWGAEAGQEIRRMMEDDPEASWSNLGLDLLFAIPGAAELGAVKALPKLSTLSKFVPGARYVAPVTKYAARPYNAVRNLATPLNALHGYFGYEAFVPHVDEEGNVQQGFAVDAAKNIYDAFTEGDEVNWDKVSENALNAYMGYAIGKGNLGMGAGAVKDLVAPNYSFTNSRFYKPYENFSTGLKRGLSMTPVMNNGKLTFVSPLDIKPQTNFEFPFSVYDFNKSYNASTTPKYEGPVPQPNYETPVLTEPTPFVPVESEYIGPIEEPLRFSKGGNLPKAAMGWPIKRKKAKKEPTTVKRETSTTLEKFIPEVSSFTTTVPTTTVAEQVFNQASIPTVQTIKETLPGYTERRQVVQNLKDLGYLGSGTVGADMLRAARSDEALNTLMQLAIDFDRTGYRQVSGEYVPQGKTMGGYGNYWNYDMTERAPGNLLSERDNMLVQGIDLTDPYSLGAYQATSIPMENYGYREGGLDYVGSGMGALYLSSLPEKINPQYGTFQFKVKQPTDFSTGNWRDWYNRYVLNKESAFQKVDNDFLVLRKDLMPTKVYFDSGYSKGTGSLLDRFMGVGQGLNTRRWIGGRGYGVGEIDPTFEFTDLKNMSLENYNAMEELKNSLIRDYETGWRGKYKKGGKLPKARYGLPIKLKSTVKPEPKSKPKPPSVTKNSINNYAKNFLTSANIATIGTVNSLAKQAFPVMVNPVHIPTFGMLAGERTMIGPFTGSPLNGIPFYGENLNSQMEPNEAFRYFGDTLDYVKLTDTLDSAHGPLLRGGKNTIVSDSGQWFEKGTPNAAYTSVFGVRANPDTPGSNLKYMPKGNRNGVLIGDMSTSNPRIINPNDPGIKFYRRYPFSNRLGEVNINDPYDLKNYGGNLQSLLERYGYAALGAAGLGAMGYNTPQEYLDEYVTDPLVDGYTELRNFLELDDNKSEERLPNPWKKKEGGMTTKLTKEQIKNYIAQGYIIEEE